MTEHLTMISDILILPLTYSLVLPVKCSHGFHFYISDNSKYYLLINVTLLSSTMNEERLKIY